MDFVIFTSINWDDQGGAHRPTQLARALAARGHRSLFVQIPAVPPRPYESNVELASLVGLGLAESDIRRAWFGFNDADLEPIARNLEARLARFEHAERRVALWAVPFVPFARLFPLFVSRGYRTIYDCIDDFAGLNKLGRYFGNARAEQFLACHADLVTAPSQPLVEKFRAASIPRVEHMPNGADLNFRSHEPAPDDLLRGELTLGFWGTISDDFVDVDALAYIARERPRWAINLIGAYDLDRARPSVAAALREVPNVRLLGRRPHDALTNYLAGLDVCLMPFPDNAFSRGRNPIKLYEYLAGYKPVVALHTPQLAGIPYVTVAGSAAEFLEGIEAARHVAVDKRAVDEFLAANSWEARGEKLLELVADLPPGERKSEGLLLPDRFEDPGTLAARTEAYLANLEQTADERLAYIRELERHARDTEAYVKKLERTHPLIWIKGLVRRL
jgi:glycosyltransferase involved in cell wall biosynthesis